MKPDSRPMGSRMDAYFPHYSPPSNNKPGYARKNTPYFGHRPPARHGLLDEMINNFKSKSMTREELVRPEVKKEIWETQFRTYKIWALAFNLCWTGVSIHNFWKKDEFGDPHVPTWI